MGGGQRAPVLGFVVLGVAVPVWWACMLHVPAARDWFFPGGDIDRALRAFVMPDVLVLASGALLTAWLVANDRPGAAAAAWFTAGAACYATVYTIAWTLDAGAPLASPLLMIAAAFLAILCARSTLSRSR